MMDAVAERLILRAIRRLERQGDTEGVMLLEEALRRLRAQTAESFEVHAERALRIANEEQV